MLIIMTCIRNQNDDYPFSEQLYAHYLSRASFYGGLICLLQTSPESPGIFRLMHRINMAESVEELREACVAKDIPEVDLKSFLVYCSGVYANMVCTFWDKSTFIYFITIGHSLLSNTVSKQN